MLPFYLCVFETFSCLHFFLPFPFPFIPSESFQYLLNFQKSVPSFHCAYILTQLLIAIAEKPMSGWKKEKMGNVWRVTQLRWVLVWSLPFKGEISLSHPDNLTGWTVLAINKGSSSKYIGPSLVCVLLCLSHMQTGTLQLSQLVFLKIRASQLSGVLSMSLLFSVGTSLIAGCGGEWSQTWSDGTSYCKYRCLWQLVSKIHWNELQIQLLLQGREENL